MRAYPGVARSVLLVFFAQQVPRRGSWVAGGKRHGLRAWNGAGCRFSSVVQACWEHDAQSACAPVVASTAALLPSDLKRAVQKLAARQTDARRSSLMIGHGGSGTRSVSKLEEELLTLRSQDSRTIARRPATRGLPRDEHAGANGHRVHSGYHDELHF